MIGVNSYHASFNVFPSACGVPNYSGSQFQTSIATIKQYSLYSQLLSFIEYSDLHNSINFSVGLQDMYLFGTENAFAAGATSNSTAWSYKLSILLCPADPEDAFSAPTGAVNYRANIGSERWPLLASDPNAGPFMGYRYVSSSEITDGLSNTVAFSEKLRGNPGRASLDPLTDMVVGGLGLPYSVDESVVNCHTQGGTPNGYRTTGGLSWIVGTLSQTCYNHTIGPNSRGPDCIVGLSNPVVGLIGARSNHGRGVNVGMVDGSVRYTAESIATNTWRAISTKSGGEVVTIDP